MDFAALEEVDGIRMTWNVWPNSKLEATKCVIPFATLYTPNRRLPGMPVSGQAPGWLHAYGRAGGLAAAAGAPAPPGMSCPAECGALNASQGASAALSRAYSRTFGPACTT